MSKKTLTPFGTPWVEYQPDLLQLIAKRQLSFKEICERLEEYYFSNGLYRQTEKGLRDLGFWRDGLRPLRNPTSRVVEFYVAHLWPGRLGRELQIEAPNQAIMGPLAQMWQWSGWERQKELAARWGALFGNLFIKVAEVGGPKVILQLIHPGDVAEVKHDARGNVVYIRIDTPFDVQDPETGEWAGHYQTEIWDLIGDSMRLWDYEAGEGVKDYGELGEPRESLSISGDLGLDFVPVIHGKAADLGFDFGMPPIWPALDKIDELNQLVTGLHARLGRHTKPTWAVTSNQQTPSGKAIPAPVFLRKSSRVTGRDDGALEIGGERFISLPSQTDIKTLVPNINYGAILEVINAQRDDIREDLPELKYGNLHELGTSNLSGRAIRLLLSDAVDRVHKMRGAYEDALTRAHKIGLTIGQKRGIWAGLGSYEAGDFEHRFAPRDVIARTEYEKAEITKLRVASNVPLEVALSWEGFTEEQIEAVRLALKQEEERAYNAFQRAAQSTAVEVGYEE